MPEPPPPPLPWIDTLPVVEHLTVGLYLAQGFWNYRGYIIENPIFSITGSNLIALLHVQAGSIWGYNLETEDFMEYPISFSGSTSAQAAHQLAIAMGFDNGGHSVMTMNEISKDEIHGKGIIIY